VNKAKINGCLNKKKYNTLEEAKKCPEQDVYKCKYCGKYHRTTQLKKLIKYIRGSKKI
jgi:hypothetical protein